MTADALPIPLPTAPGCVLGVIAVGDGKATVQCSRCYLTKTDWTLFAVAFATFPQGGDHQKYDSRGHWVDGERLCRDCREACGCAGCKRSEP